MLGSVSRMISEKKNAHHSVQQGLDSHDRVEQEAAIFATTQFASHSHKFASSICNKIAAMLQGWNEDFFDVFHKKFCSCFVCKIICFIFDFSMLLPQKNNSDNDCLRILTPICYCHFVYI